MTNWKDVAERFHNDLMNEKAKNDQLLSALDQIGVMGHIDIKGQYEKAYNECLQIASDTLQKIGYFDEE